MVAVVLNSSVVDNTAPMVVILSVALDSWLIVVTEPGIPVVVVSVVEKN